ncbi:MAG TPA: retropepsin-like aspartic protease [Rhizomicrobium sp.]|nr:retropepsin-like aspartic protease [Rhizomicrobium sp.]
MRGSVRNFGNFVLPILAVCGTPAWAEDCKPLQLANTIQLETVAGGRRILVPVRINGKPLQLLLDTAGVTTQLSEATVKALGLKEEASGFGLHDVLGNRSEGEVVIDNLDVGRLRDLNAHIHVAPNPNLDADGFNGLFVPNFRGYDIDLDFGSSRLNLFFRDHCPGNVVYWQERPLAVVPATLNEFDYHIAIPVTIDGRKFTGELDTGAPRSFMSADDARSAFDFEPGTPQWPLIGSVNGSSVNEYGHQFATLSFEGVTVTNPAIAVFEGRMGEPPVPWRHGERKPLVVIGMDVLKNLHIFVALGEGKLYVTRAGTGESPLLKMLPPVQPSAPPH